MRRHLGTMLWILLLSLKPNGVTISYFVSRHVILLHSISIYQTRVCVGVNDSTPSCYVYVTARYTIICFFQLCLLFNLRQLTLLHGYCHLLIQHLPARNIAGARPLTQPKPFIHRDWPSWFYLVTTWQIYFYFLLALLGNICHIWPNSPHQ